VTAREELAALVVLQRLLDKKSILKRQMDTPPDELIELRIAFASRRQSLDEKRQRSESLTAEQAKVQGELEALREEREHFRKQKSMVTNMKQLSAVVSELDHVETQLKAKEDRALEVMQELEALAADIAALQAETPEEKAQREQGEATWEESRKAASVHLHEIERQMREVRSQLGDRAFERFRKLWNSRKPAAVVPLEGTSCSFCHAELRPSLVQVVRTLETLQYCDSCRRLLYDPEQFPAPQ
jgi:predicted  nucleic acid-binding Zn-ribbon protein